MVLLPQPGEELGIVQPRGHLLQTRLARTAAGRVGVQAGHAQAGIDQHQHAAVEMLFALAPPSRLEIDDQQADQHQGPQQRQPQAEIPGQLARIAAVDPEQAGQGSPAECRRTSTNRRWTGFVRTRISS